MKERNITISRNQLDELLENNKIDKICRTISIFLYMIFTVCTINIVLDIFFSNLYKITFFKTVIVMVLILIMMFIISLIQVKNSMYVYMKHQKK